MSDYVCELLFIDVLIKLARGVNHTMQQRYGGKSQYNLSFIIPLSLDVFS